MKRDKSIIVGFGHKRRRGKDTACDLADGYLNYLNLNSVQTAFASSLKKAAGIIFGLTDSQLYGDAKMEVDNFWNATPRTILQRMGTEAMREGFDENIWVRSLERSINRLPADTSVFVGDVRFPNEAKAIHDWGGYLIRIDRDIEPGEEGEDSHASETALDDYEGWDAVIENNGTIGSLTLKVQEVVASFLTKAGILD